MSVFSEHTIETSSGAFVDFMNPENSVFLLADIARGLSVEPRFNGHTIGVKPYSVAQHSVCVMKTVEKVLTTESRLQKMFLAMNGHDKDLMNFVHLWPEQKPMVMKLGLLHDASEAYMKDLASPLKSMPRIKESYGGIEAQVMTEILDQQDVTFGDIQLEWAWKIVHWADAYCCAVEAFNLLPSRGRDWQWNAELVSLLQPKDFVSFKQPWSAPKAYKKFIDAVQYTADASTAKMA